MEILELKNTVNEMTKGNRELQHKTQLNRRAVNSKTSLLKFCILWRKKNKESKEVKKNYQIYRKPSQEPIYALWESQKEKRKK